MVEFLDKIGYVFEVLVYVLVNERWLLMSCVFGDENFVIVLFVGNKCVKVVGGCVLEFIVFWC